MERPDPTAAVKADITRLRRLQLDAELDGGDTDWLQHLIDRNLDTLLRCQAIEANA